MSYRMGTTLAACIAMCFVCGATGCSSKPPLGEVAGKVTLNGQPLAGVAVIFLPDPEQGNQGERSTALTDENGNYTLTHESAAARQGALAGWHRVLIEDTAVENREPGGPKVPRCSSRYASAADTPLKFKVLPGAQSIDIAVEP